MSETSGASTFEHLYNVLELIWSGQREVGLCFENVCLRYWKTDIKIPKINSGMYAKRTLILFSVCVCFWPRIRSKKVVLASDWRSIGRGVNPLSTHFYLWFIVCYAQCWSLLFCFVYEDSVCVFVDVTKKQMTPIY